jgi:nicotinate phosphoribosyltransferase
LLYSKLLIKFAFCNAKRVIIIDMKQIIQHLTDNDAYTFSCQYYVLQKYPRAEVEYTFFDRNKERFPHGFGELLKEQIGFMPHVMITEDEIAFMKRKMYYLPEWYFTFLRGYRFNPHEVSVSQDEEGHLQILAGGLVLGDMGTRRRLSFDHQDMVIRTMKEVFEQGGYTDGEGFHKWTGRFTGTSNVYLAMKYDLIAIGTMSHQLIEFEENVSGVFECNFNVMKKFSDVYDGDNGIYLYDCFGDRVFFSNLSKRMAMMFNGLRVDSGVEEEQTEKIINKYKGLGINPATKQVVFSNGLDIRRAIEIHRYVAGRVQDSYGMGTFLTCDVEGCEPMNIVLKLTRSRITENREWHDCVKLSCDKGKTLGDAEKCAYLLKQIG